MKALMRKKKKLYLIQRVNYKKGNLSWIEDNVHIISR